MPGGYTLAGYPPCRVCKHLLERGNLDTLEGWRCKAFPEGIGTDILDRSEDHREPLPLDNGYQFEGAEIRDEDGVLWRYNYECEPEEVRE